jgi:hypothetical protein
VMGPKPTGPCVCGPLFGSHAIRILHGVLERIASGDYWFAIRHRTMLGPDALWKTNLCLDYGTAVDGPGIALRHEARLKSSRGVTTGCLAVWFGTMEC